MSIGLSSEFTQRTYQWTAWKVVRTARSGVTQYDDDGSIYTIWFYDGPEAYVTSIWKGIVPDGVIVGGYSQAQNDSDESDFVTNFLPTANAATYIRTKVEGLGTAGSASGGVLTIQGSASGTAIPVSGSVSVSPPADTTASGTLGALNASTSIAVSGQVSVGFQLSSGTLIGTIVPELSIDGGATWVQSQFDDPTTITMSSSIIFAASNTATTRSIVLTGGCSHARVRVSAYTSGTASAALRATQVFDPAPLYVGAKGVLVPPGIVQVGATDGHLLRALRVSPIRGDLLMSPRQVLVESSGSDFTNVDTVFWAQTAVNGGTATQASGALTLATNVTSNGNIALNPARFARYMHGTTNVWTATIQLPSGAAPNANNTARWGIMAGTNGIRFAMVLGTFRIEQVIAGVITNIDQSTWTGPSTFVMDGNYHNYEIQYNSDTVIFSIDGLVVHYLSRTLSAPSFGAMNLGPALSCSNSGGGTTNVLLNVRGVSICRIGPAVDAEQTYAHIIAQGTTILKIGTGFLKKVIINQVGLATNNATIWDSPSAAGNQVAIMNLTTARTVDFDCVLRNGLTVQVAGTFIGDLTVVYS